MPIPAPLLEQKARLLRQLAYAGRRGLWALYLDTTKPQAWHFYLPPQWSCPEGVRANLSYPLVQVPGPQLRLAGTFQSAPLMMLVLALDDDLPLLRRDHFFPRRRLFSLSRREAVGVLEVAL